MYAIINESAAGINLVSLHTTNKDLAEDLANMADPLPKNHTIRWIDSLEDLYELLYR